MNEATIDTATLAGQLVRIATQAGATIMSFYDGDIAVETKDDNSPVTAADGAAEEIIIRALSEIAGDIPVVAEEAAAKGDIPEVKERFFLVDPLDGTKEFVKKNGEFTVNIALIESGAPTVGVVYAPARNRMFFGFGHGNAFEQHVEPISTGGPTPSTPRPIKARLGDRNKLVAVASRSHRDHKTDEYLSHYNIERIVAAGSSLKFCLIAVGDADIYPRHGRTMEWDTAAGHAVVNAAGGTVTKLDGSPFLYGKAVDKFANPFFVARGQTA
jgi:3'(2'), 5'-bisphosphate nucleotidase